MKATTRIRTLSQSNNLHLIIFIHLIIGLAIGLYIYYLISGLQEIGNEQFKLLIYISFIFLLWQCYSWYKIEGTLFNPYIMYSTLLYIFHFGQVLLWAINLYPSTYHFLIFERVPYDLIVDSVIFSTCTIVLFHTGALVFGSLARYKIKFVTSSKKIVKTSKDNKHNLLLAMKYTGIVLCLISVIPMLIVDISVLIIAFNSGYLATYGAEVKQGILDNLAYFFTPGIIFLLIGIKDNRRLFNILFYMNIFYSLINIVIAGRRGYEVIFIITLIWLSHILIEPIKGKKVIKYGLISYFGLSLLGIVGEIRGSARTEVEFSNIIELIFTNNPIIRQVMEFGGTLFTVTLIMKYAPNIIPFVEGFTYKAAFLKLLPLSRSQIREIESEASTSVVLNNYIGGIGDSLIAEFYYNFAWQGMLIAVVFGFFIGFISYKAKKSIEEKDYPLIAFFAIFLYQILWTVRSSTVSIPYNMIVYIGFPYLLCWLIYNYIMRRVKV